MVNIGFINPLIIPGSKNDTRFDLVPFDYSGLAAYYGSGVSQGTTNLANALAAGPLGDLIRSRENEDIIPPWLQNRTVENEELTLQQRVFLGDPLINLSDSSIDREGIDDETKAMFAMFKALDRMNELAEFAQTTTGQNMAYLLERRFQGWVTELKEFIAEQSFEDLSLLSGIQVDGITSTIARQAIDPVDLALGLPIDDVYTGLSISSVRTDPISGIVGDETFTITVTEGNVDTALAIDLSAAGGNDIDSIVTYLNGVLSGSGFATEFSVKRFNEDNYGLEIVTSTGEALAFSNPSDPTSAVYVSGIAGGGDFSSGFLTKVGDLSADDPTKEYYRSIFTPDYDAGGSVAVDSNGYVYVVGTTSGSMDDQIATGSNDVFLKKYDPSGRVEFTHMLGTAPEASGMAITIDSRDNVYIAGQAYGPLTTSANSANSGTADSFVTKFDSTGQEEWTRQAGNMVADGALDLTVDTSGNVYVSGFVSGQIDSSATHAGAQDAFVTKLDTDGTLVYNEQFGTTTDDQATAIAVDSNGNVFVAGTIGSNGYLRKYDSSTTPVLTYNLDLGDLGTDGGVTAITMDSAGDVFIGGYTNETGVSGRGTDGFVIKVDDQNSTAVNRGSAYVGTTGTDRIQGLSMDTATGDLYMTGDTTGGFAGEEDQEGPVDGFIAKLNSGGREQWVHQFGGSANYRPKDIVFDTDGTSVLSRLGLPNGTMFPTEARTIVAQTTVREGQYFHLDVDDRTHSTITIENDTTFSYLASRINFALGTDGRAEVKKTGDVESLTITAKNGSVIEIKAGREGFDALSGLGFRPAIIMGKPRNTGDQKETDLIEASRFALGFTPLMNVSSKKDGDETQALMNNAIREIKAAYRFKILGFEEDVKPIGPPPPAIAIKIAAYSEALARLRGGSGGGMAGF